ncbi:MAG: hypothetical protein LIO44_00255 [Eubacterium sp.]|nr:hypothetical protein [Eubacterium sp.]
MKYFKLKTGVSEIFEIEKNRFDYVTDKKKPYYEMEGDTSARHFAVCPACDNPIQIIGLYKKLKNSQKPYGKHYNKSISKLAVYNEQAYRFCPYARKKNKVFRESRKSILTDYEKSIYNLMREQFDRVVYVLSKEIDIKIYNATAEKMLSSYVADEGWLYPWATLNNLPWVFGYLYMAQNLYGKLIAKNSPLYNKIKESFPNVVFSPVDYLNDYEKFGVKEGTYIHLDYCIMHHKREVDEEDGTLKETMLLSVSEGNAVGSGINRIYRKELTINETYFMNFISKSSGYRNQRLLDIAERLMPPL